MELETAQHLLQQVSIISKKYVELAKITGENFNVFKILKLETREVRTHSSMLAELLNPHGSHGKGAVFLKLFLKQVNYAEFEIANSTVEVEKNVGEVNLVEARGGYIDIVITNKKQALVIENKIYAGDQSRQLERYHNYCKVQFSSSFKLFYLTLSSTSPDKKSIGANLQIGKDVELISYSNDIIQWLEECRKEAATLPLLRETITQYIYLLKDLTGQTTNNKMTNEVAKAITRDEASFSSAFTIASSLDSAKIELLDLLKKHLANISALLGLEFYFDPNFGNAARETCLEFYHSKSEDIRIHIGFDEWRFGFYIGLWAKDIESTLKEKFKTSRLSDEVGQDHDYPNYYYLHYFENTLSNWGGKEIWLDIINGTLADKLEKYLKTITEVMKNCRN